MINSILPAIVGTSLKALGQERNQSDSGLAKQISSKKYIDMADDMATQAQERQKYTSAVKPQADYSFINTVNSKYKETLATLSDVQEAAKRQALRQGLSSATSGDITPSPNIFNIIPFSIDSIETPMYINLLKVSNVIGSCRLARTLSKASIGSTT